MTAAAVLAKAPSGLPVYVRANAQRNLLPQEARLAKQLRELEVQGAIPFAAFCQVLDTPETSFFAKHLYSDCQAGPGGASAECVAAAALQLQRGSQEDLLRLMFTAYLIEKGDSTSGKLGAADLKVVLQELLADTRLPADEAVLDQLAADIVELADTEGDGSVSFEQLYALARRLPRFRQLFAGLTERYAADPAARCASVWASLGETASLVWWTIVGAFPKLSFWLIFAACGATGLYFYLAPDLTYQINATDVWIAKFFGPVAAVASVFIMPPMTKLLTDNLRRIKLFVKLFDFDQNISIHKALGLIILFSGLIHGICWSTAFVRADHTESWAWDSLMTGGINHLDPTLPQMFGSQVAITGFIMLAALFIALPFALKYPKKAACLKDTRLGRWLNDYRFFWASHRMLFVVYYVALILHPMPGNPTVAHKGKVWIYVTLPLALYLVDWAWGAFRRFRQRALVQKVEVFEGARNKVLALYLRRPRVFGKRFAYKPGQFVRVCCPNISALEWHPFTLSSSPDEELLTLHIEAVGDWTQALFALAKEGRDSLGRTAGPCIPWWMSRGKGLGASRRSVAPAEVAETDKEAGGEAEGAAEEASAGSGDVEMGGTGGKLVPSQDKFPTIYLQGPIGAPAMAYKRYDVLLLACTGIGVTPMVSILKALATKAEDPAPSTAPTAPGTAPPAASTAEAGSTSKKRGSKQQTKQVYFRWTVREQHAPQWVEPALAKAVEAAAEGEGTLDLSIHYTGAGAQPHQAQRLMLELANEVRLLKGRRDLLFGTTPSGIRTHYGRPDWEATFQQVQRENPDAAKIGVLFCGAKPVEKELRRMCKDYSTPRGQTFHLHAENF